jgi:hypothetical protein
MGGSEGRERRVGERSLKTGGLKGEGRHSEGRE